MRYCIADIRLSEKCKDTLRSLGYDVILMPPFRSLSEPVASHPDMLILLLNGRIFTHKNYYSANADIIDKISALTNSELYLSDEAIGCNYPNDVLFNAFPFGDHFVCNQKTVSSAVLKYAKDTGLSTVHVNQGYTKCASCVTESFILTADKGILKALDKHGLPLHKVSEGQILLDGCSHGFIGGASGYDKKEKRLFICGDLSKHTDGERIQNICKKYGITVVSLSCEIPYDYGTLFFI